MSLVKLSNRLQVRMIELLHNLDVNRDTQRFNDIMLDYCKSGVHLSHRLKLNGVLKELEDLAEMLPEATNEQLDKIIEDLKLLDNIVKR